MNQSPAEQSPDNPTRPSDQRRGLILCPLHFEYRVLAASSQLARRCRIACCGPGQDAALTTLIELENSAGALPAFIIMAGLAGALHHSLSIGDVRVARRIMTDDGQSWMATWPTTRTQAAGVVNADMLTTRRILRLPDEKRMGHMATSCTMVDTESAALAAWASDVKIAWGVVRAVSDEVNDEMPDGIDHWNGPDGKPRLGRIARDCIARPGNIGVMSRLKRRSDIAMDALRIALEKMISAADSGGEAR